MASNIIPMGPCSLSYTLEGSATALIIKKTREEQDTILTVTEEIVAINYDQLVGAQGGTSNITAATLACSFDLDLALLPQLKSNWKEGKSTGIGLNPIGVPLDFGVLQIHPISEGTNVTNDIIGKRVSSTISIDASFKKDGMLRINALFNFSSNDKEADPDYGYLMTFGELD